MDDAIEVRWDLDGRSCWWPALVREQAPDGRALLDYVSRGGIPAHRSTVYRLNARELLDTATESTLRWRPARHPPTFTAAEIAALQSPDDPQIYADAQQQLRQLSAPDKRRFRDGMGHLHQVIRDHLATLPAGHVVTAEDVAAATAGL